MDFHYDPQPPFEAVMPAHGQLISTYATAASMVVVLAIAIFYSFKERSAAHLYAVIGSGLAVFLESFTLVLCLAWHSKVGQWTALTTFGRPLPLYVIFIYWPYYYVPFLIFDSTVKRGKMTQSRYWMIYGLFCALAFGSEFFLLRGGFHQYYGPQPLQIFGMPVYWDMICASMTVTSAVIMVIMKSYLPSRWLPLMVLVPPAMEGGLPMFEGWPVIDAINGGAPPWAIWTTSLIAMITTVGVVYGFWRVLMLAPKIRRYLSDKRAPGVPAILEV